jgi:hypothetical protein
VSLEIKEGVTQKELSKHINASELLQLNSEILIMLKEKDILKDA